MKNRTLITILLTAAYCSPAFVNAESMREAVVHTIETNPDIQFKIYERRSTEQELEQAYSGYRPTVDLNAAYGRERSDNPSTRAGGNDHVDLNRSEASINVRQMLFDGFATKSEVERQQARTESSAYAVHGTIDNLAFRAVEVYLELLRKQELLKEAENNLLAHKRIFDQIELRSKSGVSRKADLEQVRGRRALAFTNVETEKSNLRDAETSYLRVVGRLPVSTLARPEIEKLELPSSLEEAIDQALKNHPTLKSANADVKAAQAQRHAANNSMYPHFHLELEKTANNDLDAQVGDNNDGSVMVRMQYNLFRGGKDKARVSETVHRINESQEVRNRTQRQVEESIRLSWNAYKSTAIQLSYLKDHVDASISTKDSYAKQFNIGKRTLLDLLDSENELFQSRRAYTNGQFDNLVSYYRIFNSIGILVGKLDVALPAKASKKTSP